MAPVRGDGKGENTLAHAAVLAKRFGALVQVVHCHPNADDMMPFGVVIPSALRRQIEQAAAQSASTTKEHHTEEFRVLAQRFGLAVQDFERGKATAQFIEYEGKQVDAVRYFGRLCDLICVPQPDTQQNLGMNTLKAALFSSARPVMMCPPQDRVDEGFTDRIAIGWNGSLEASRAVAMAAPLLMAASEVTILSADRSDSHAASPDDLQRYLHIKGVGSNVRRFKAKKGVVGRQLLDECRSIGAGALLMGAYHESYERETVFGGNSQAVVQSATIPVVMVH